MKIKKMFTRVLMVSLITVMYSCTTEDVILDETIDSNDSILSTGGGPNTDDSGGSEDDDSSGSKVST
ncbi:hypothetical protein [Flavivirga eckloniae]|uniref:Uncharacterized protein n=1 Tax=Flavivirga eckloniae TaxID=1803846 RepID=A0A2K9PNB3_9FLAO|nr:hypothetical protein [Flavivirga eckloniae]AUP78542.1 hypothetical protein C1H87_07385 [Flavivirga eckloniae]